MSDAIDRVHNVSQLFGTTPIMNAKRKAFLLNKYQTALNAVIAASNYKTLNSSEMLFSAINSLDQCPKGKYTDWLIRRFFDGDILVPDILGSTFRDLNSELTMALKTFHEHKQFLPIKDINRLPSTQSLIELTTSDPNSELPISNRDKKRKYKERLLANRDIECLHKSKVCTLYKINTKEGAVFLGRGTRWCTAGREHNSFDQYHNDGPLYVLIDNKGDKYQLHFPTSSFFDSKDFPIDPMLVGSYFKSINDELHTHLPSFEFNRFSTSEKLNSEYCAELFLLNEQNVKYLPKELIIDEFWINVIAINKSLLKTVPITILTQQFYHKCLESRILRIDNIPPNKITKEMIKEAFKHSDIELKRIPSTYIDKELSLLALEHNGFNLKHLPKSVISHELCLKAIVSNPWCLNLIPAPFDKRDLCILAMEEMAPLFINLTTEQVRFTSSHILNFFQKSLTRVPNEAVYLDLCLQAINEETCNLDDIPHFIRTSEFISSVVDYPQFSLKHIHHETQTLLICELAISRDPMQLEFVISPLRTKELIYKAIEECIHALYFLTGDDWDLELCNYAIGLSEEAYQYIPERFKRLIPNSKFGDSNDDYFY